MMLHPMIKYSLKKLTGKHTPMRVDLGVGECFVNDVKQLYFMAGDRMVITSPIVTHSSIPGGFLFNTKNSTYMIKESV